MDHRLVDIFETFGLDQHVKEATRGDNMLDVVATHPSLVVTNVRVDEAGMVFDHRLVIATLQLPVVPVVPAVPITLHYITLFHNAAYTLSDQWCINKVIFIIHRRA